MKQIKGIVAGAGYFSDFHLEAWKRIPEVTLVALADPDLQKAQEKAKRYDIPNTFNSVREMLEYEAADFIDLITPPHTHLELITLAAERNLPIICQKPLSDTYEEAIVIKSILEKSGVPFMVHENWRFQPWYREIKKIIASGIIGKTPVHIQSLMRMGDGWKADAYLDRQPYFRTMPRLLMHETGIHFIDTFRYLFGEISDVTAILRSINPQVKGEDKAIVMLEFINGASGILDASRYNEPFHENARYTFGRMLLEMDGGGLELFPDGSIQVKPLGEKAFKHPYSPSKKGFAGDSVWSCQRHFIEQLSNQQPFDTGIADYFENIKIIEAVYLSHLEKQKIHLDNNAVNKQI